MTLKHVDLLAACLAGALLGALGVIHLDEDNWNAVIYVKDDTYVVDHRLTLDDCLELQVKNDAIGCERG